MKSIPTMTISYRFPVTSRLSAAYFIASVCFWVIFAGSSLVQAEGPGRVTSLKEIREQGVVMQKWETSCAAATLATVLTYGFHDPVSERQAAGGMLENIEPKKVRARGGFSLLDMKRFVEARGYKASAYKNLAFDDLKLFQAPIIPIDNFGYNHYVVFNGFRGNSIILADPAFGNREMSLERFKSLWIDGIAFVVTRK